MGENISMKEVKAKIKNLRSTYHQELNKIKKSKTTGSGTNNVYNPTSIWFDEMAFLNDTFEYRDTTSSHVSTYSFILQVYSSKKNSHTEDEFYYFGKSIAAQLRSLSLTHALQVQTKIQTLISNERCQPTQSTIAQNSPYSHTSSHSPHQSTASYSQPSTKYYHYSPMHSPPIHNQVTDSYSKPSTPYSDSTSMHSPPYNMKTDPTSLSIQLPIIECKKFVLN
ncbi:uncharacterized protein [Leptinotarsa decemlineata]|uniref:uncharacterized protein n=1 Tax=Leptinotarsa decemlineata TaxID=7539 RepID=UPI003D308401